jgi:cyclophilin family peptidyl-prolyl cis-trans isomerase
MYRRSFVAALGLYIMAMPTSAQTVAPAAPPAAAPAPKVYLTTRLGEIEITLDPVGAPKTSVHMLKLFQSNHYVGAAIYRVEPGFLIQLGDLDANWQHRWPPRPLMGQTVALETATNKHGRGTVSLARADDPNSGQSTFYFDLGENSSLNATPGAPPNTTGYATFGRVTAGMTVIDAIAVVPRAPTGGPFPGKAPLEPIIITAVRTDPAAAPPPRAAPAAVPKSKAKAGRNQRPR